MSQSTKRFFGNVAYAFDSLVLPALIVGVLLCLWVLMPEVEVHWYR